MNSVGMRGLCERRVVAWPYARKLWRVLVLPGCGRNVPLEAFLVFIYSLTKASRLRYRGFCQPVRGSTDVNRFSDIPIF